jgi:hypothetical protein
MYCHFVVNDSSASDRICPLNDSVFELSVEIIVPYSPKDL